jgi:hydroxypyruvate isomerase
LLNLKVLDLYHAHKSWAATGTLMRRHMAQIGHVQVAGVPDRHGPTEGELSVRHCSHCSMLGYSGWIGCGTYRPKGKNRDGLQWLREFQNAAKEMSMNVVITGGAVFGSAPGAPTPGTRYAGRPR